MLMGDYWWLSSPCSEYPSTLGLDLCLRRALGKVNTQVMLEYLPPWRYKPAYCESQLVTTSLGFLHDEPWKLCVQSIDAYHPPPRSSLPHLQFFNALLFASPWILVPSWSLMMFSHSKSVLLNHLKPKPYWWIAKFREMDLLKNIFKYCHSSLIFHLRHLSNVVEHLNPRLDRIVQIQFQVMPQP